MRFPKRREQVRSRHFINELAKNALKRADLRQCLQSHIEGLNGVVTSNISLDLERKSQILALIERIDQTVTAKLDYMDQAVREIIQIVSLFEIYVSLVQ